jgi:general secretion pathway protein N
MRATRLFLLGAAAYGAFLLATLPAAVVAPRVAAATSGRVTLEQAAGTVWSGSARVAISGRGFAAVLDEVRWRFQPARLLSGRLAYAVEARMGGLRGEAEVSRTPLAWRADGLRAKGDATAIAALVPLAAVWSPAGEIALEAPQLAWQGERITGAATLDWRDAASSLSTVRPLGSWRAQATAEGTSVKLSLATVKGPLRLAGNGSLDLPGRFAFSGEARAEPGRERDLESILAHLGPRRADGAHGFGTR